MSTWHIAWFISAHGFGHAARACAVMAALRRCHHGAHFHVYTAVPSWFFDDSAIGPVSLRRLETDVGVVQDTPLAENPGETLRCLNAFFPLSDSLIRGLADELVQQEIRLVVADIAPVGIAAADMAGIPSVLIENFTWDWIYERYAGRWPGFERHIAYLDRLFDDADVRIQAVPVCRPVACHLTAPPMSREARTPASTIRASLGIPDGKSMVLLSLGGTPVSQDALSALRVPEGFRIVAPGGPERLGNVHRVVRLPVHSPYYHPDLIRAADAVIGKAGYSTMAEVYRYGTPFGFVSRPNFREAPIMEAFITEAMGGRRISSSVFESGNWEGLLADLVAMPTRTATVENGADTVARFLTARFGDCIGGAVTDG
jgi:UDP:flavonoid glycosyltransferase YjiC (YdhE family)